MQSIPGLERFDLPSGARFLKIHHYADPAKDAQWLAAVKQDMIDTPRDFRRQILMEEDVYDGEPVFDTYLDVLHCPEKYRTQLFPIVKYEHIVCGIDCGMTLTPAAIVMGITTLPFQVHGIVEVVSEGGEPMETFAPRLLATIQKVCPYQWCDVEYVGDATVTQKSGGNGESAQQVAKRILTKTIQPMSNVWAVRQSDFSWLLNDRITDKNARFVLNGYGCPTLRKALQGAYQFELSARGDSSGPGRVLTSPLKNAFSHIADGGQYAAQKVRKIIEGRSGGRVHRRKAMRLAGSVSGVTPA